MEETQVLHRGRLIDHIQLVVKDVATSRRFYDAVMATLGLPLGGSADRHFWYDELFVSSPDGPEALGKLTGRHHLAFQAKNRMVDSFYKAALENGGADILPKQFDAFVWFDETQAVTPLGPEHHKGMPETYPFGE